MTSCDGLSGGLPGQVDVFRYAVAEKAGFYRMLLRVFAREKERYRIQVRPGEVRSGLPDSLRDVPAEEVALALDQLVLWGNLKRTQDTQEAGTLSEFYQRRSLYQLTPEGEEAHRGVEAVDALFSRSGGRLSGVMLPRIEEHLQALQAEWAADPADPAKLYRLLVDLNAPAAELAENARRFMNDLAESIENVADTDDSFLAYKRAVLVYLESFVAVLSRYQPRVASLIRVLDAGAPELVALAASADEAPSLQRRDRGPVAELAARWSGLRRWFVGDPGEPAEADNLRRATVDAINRILRVLERINERRYRRVDRTADFMRLALWFSGSGSPRDAAGLFDRAFGLYAARHLTLEADDEERDRGMSFLEAPPVAVAPRLRLTGRRSVPGRPAALADFSHAKRRAFRRIYNKASGTARAARLFAGESRRLSDLPRLDGEQFALLLSLLDAALRVPPARDGSRRSFDSGSGHTVHLGPPDRGEPAIIETELGRLRAPDYLLRVEPAPSRPSPSGRRS